MNALATFGLPLLIYAVLVLAIIILTRDGLIARAWIFLLTVPLLVAEAICGIVFFAWKLSH